MSTVSYQQLKLPQSLSEELFTHIMKKVGPFEENPRIAVAVSGGSDSMALCALIARWTYYYDGQTVALTINHGLRPESIIEGYTVTKRLATLNIPHYILAYEGPIPQANIQNAARTVRYKLLEEWCYVHGVLHLVLAHHKDDQAETILLRIARGSSIHGLASMKAITYRRYVRIIRPLLEVTKKFLNLTCLSEGLESIDDTSNHSILFARVRMRHILETEGINTSNLSKMAMNLAQANAAINSAVLHYLIRNASISPFGFISLSVTNLATIPREVVLRILSYLLQITSGRLYPPCLEQLEALYKSVLTGRSGTLYGCRFQFYRGNFLLFREYKEILPPLEIVAGESIYWDRRFIVVLTQNSLVNLRVGALGERGWYNLTRIKPLMCEYLPDWIGWTLPALYTSSGTPYPLIPPDSSLKPLQKETEKMHITAVFAPNTLEITNLSLGHLE